MSRLPTIDPDARGGSTRVPTPISTIRQPAFRNLGITVPSGGQPIAAALGRGSRELGRALTRLGAAQTQSRVAEQVLLNRNSITASREAATKAPIETQEAAFVEPLLERERTIGDIKSKTVQSAVMNDLQERAVQSRRGMFPVLYGKERQRAIDTREATRAELLKDVFDNVRTTPDAQQEYDDLISDQNTVGWLSDDAAKKESILFDLDAKKAASDSTKGHLTRLGAVLVEQWTDMPTDEGRDNLKSQFFAATAAANAAGHISDQEAAQRDTRFKAALDSETTRFYDQQRQRGFAAMTAPREDEFNEIWDETKEGPPGAEQTVALAQFETMKKKLDDANIGANELFLSFLGTIPFRDDLSASESSKNGAYEQAREMGVPRTEYAAWAAQVDRIPSNLVKELKAMMTEGSGFTDWNEALSILQAAHSGSPARAETLARSTGVGSLAITGLDVVRSRPGDHDVIAEALSSRSASKSSGEANERLIGKRTGKKSDQFEPVDATKRVKEALPGARDVVAEHMNRYRSHYRYRFIEARNNGDERTAEDMSKDIEERAVEDLQNDFARIQIGPVGQKMSGLAERLFGEGNQIPHAFQGPRILTEPIERLFGLEPMFFEYVPVEMAPTREMLKDLRNHRIDRSRHGMFGAFEPEDLRTAYDLRRFEGGSWWVPIVGDRATVSVMEWDPVTQETRFFDVDEKTVRGVFPQRVVDLVTGNSGDDIRLFSHNTKYIHQKEYGTGIVAVHDRGKPRDEQLGQQMWDDVAREFNATGRLTGHIDTDRAIVTREAELRFLSMGWSALEGDPEEDNSDRLQLSPTVQVAPLPEEAVQQTPEPPAVAAPEPAAAPAAAPQASATPTVNVEPESLSVMERAIAQARTQVAEGEREPESLAMLERAIETARSELAEAPVPPGEVRE